jgi:hypothetical protein
MYSGPSVFGKMCDPRTLPHWPIAMNIGMPVAFFVSDPRLCATKTAKEPRVSHGDKKEPLNRRMKHSHHAIIMPIVVYVPLVIQNVAK